MVGSCVAAAVVSTWLVRPLKRLDNRSPAEAIRAGNLEAVRKVIHAYAHRMYSGGKRITEIPHRPRKHPATGSNIADEDIRTTSANPV
ncbi:MAG: hypothetical protein ABI670_01180 [Chloroflexota bacterium]